MGRLGLSSAFGRQPSTLTPHSLGFSCLGAGWVPRVFFINNMYIYVVQIMHYVIICASLFVYRLFTFLNYVFMYLFFLLVSISLYIGADYNQIPTEPFVAALLLPLYNSYTFGIACRTLK